MTPPVPVGIVAHYSRRKRAEKLSELIDAEVISFDWHKVGAGANHEICYQWLAESDAPWVVLLEDDAIPVRGFRQQLNQVLAAAPEDSGLISLYLGRTRPPQWQISIAKVIARDENFLKASELLHHVAVAIRTPLIPSMLKFIREDRQYSAGKLPIDEAIGRWCRAIGMPVLYTHPSIVNHEAKIQTVIKKHVSQHKTDTGKRSLQEMRIAWCFGKRDQWLPSVAAIPEPSNAYPAATATSPRKG